MGCYPIVRCGGQGNILLVYKNRDELEEQDQGGGLFQNFRKSGHFIFTRSIPSNLGRIRRGNIKIAAR